MVGRRVSAWLSSVGAIALSMVLMLGTVAMVWGSAPAIAQADDFTKANLLNQDFSGQDLRNSEFTKASLRQSDLSNTDLRGVSFFAANLERVDLTNADLRYATLDSARFVNANLTNANLEGAFASSAQFQGAIIDGADFTDVLLRNDAVDVLCEVAKGVNPTTGRATRDTLYCP
ncbi:MAG: pentapeptide repeat-containing protein [Cyanobacteria bacterium P01_C01_bin.89]